MTVVMLSAARMATAQCDGPKRPPTAAEAKAYADGFALFQRIAPKAPAGWTATDSRTEPVITFICASPLYNFTHWSFSRTFNRSQTEMQARGDAALKKTEAVMARADARNKAKETKLADLDRRQADLAKRIETAAGQQNFAALAAISEESNKLAAEREALMTDSVAETEMTAIDAEVTRDQTAQFTMSYGETDVAMSNPFKPMASAVGKGFRQEAVVRLEPQWNALPSDVPPPVRTLLESCLVKDPRRRVGDISTALFVLDKAASLAAPAVMPHTTATATTFASGGRWVWMAGFGVAALAMFALAIPAVRHLRETPPPLPPEMRVEIGTPATDQPTMFALSPDGRQIAFVASGEGASRLWLRSLATTMAQPLAGTEGARYPFWSPDGRSIGFFSGSALKRLDIGGGAPRTLAPVVNGSGGTWNADGVIVFAPSFTTPLMRVAAIGGAALPVTTLSPHQASHLWPWFLPDGRRFLFTAAGGSDVAGIYLAALDGSTPTRLTSADGSGIYLPAEPGHAQAFRESGWLLWLQAGSLLARQLDLVKGELTGDPVTLADGTADRRSAVSVAATGLVAYRTALDTERQLTWVDRSGTVRGVLGDPDSTLYAPRVSPDGRRVVVARGVPGNRHLWLLDGARANRFTFDAGDDYFPVWSPDGTRIVYLSKRTGRGDIYQKRTDGAGVEEPLLASDQFKAPDSWSADGRFLLYDNLDPRTGWDILVTAMAGDGRPSAFLQTPSFEAWSVFSPDGRWVAYESNESGRMEVYVRPFLNGAAHTAAGAGGGQWQMSTAGGIMPAWRRDGKELYYLSPAGDMMAVPVTVTGTSLEPGAPVMLFPTRIVGGGVDAQQGRQYDVAPDGRFLINTERAAATAPITLLMNWDPAEKK
jgi:Tol biopolymer transport system component